MNFLTVTLTDGGKVDIPPGSVVFIEDLNKAEQGKWEHCKTGLFYNLGDGSTRVLMVREESEAVAKSVLPASGGTWIKLDRPNGAVVRCPSTCVLAMTEHAAAKDGEAKCTAQLRIGERIHPYAVTQTRDEIHALINPPKVEKPSKPTKAKNAKSRKSKATKKEPANG